MALPRFCYLVAALLASCAATPSGRLVPDPWPRVAEVWTPVPKPGPFKPRGNSITAFTSGVRYEASGLSDGIVQIRVARGDFDPAPSYAVERRPGGIAPATHDELEAAAREVARHLNFTNGPGWRWFRALEPGEAIVGLGERPGSLHQRGRRAVMWNSDNFSYPPDAERLYQSIPFWMSLKHGRARGFFVDNTFRMGFDAGSHHPDVFEVAASDGDFNLYLIEGPTPREVVERFAKLTGRPDLPPLWALGYQQCRWSYDSQEWVEFVARSFRENRIPCDVIYTDIDYMDGYRCFTIDRGRFPAFQEMTARLGAHGIRIVSIIDPGIKVDPGWNIYNEGHARGYFVKSPGGGEYVGRVWPGSCVFPDFTNPDVQAWWGRLYAPLVEAGVAGFWNDMNEPSVFDGPDKTMPEDSVHAAGPHGRIHNAYGMLMAKATRDGILQLRPDLRPFVLTRANYAGGQRYAATWTGDNQARWPELKYSISMTLNLGLSGQPFAGPDIGGFNTNMERGDPPFPDCTPELHARWLEFGCLLPVARSHTIKGSMDREPYAYGEPWTTLNRKSIERRYRLLPYLYTLAEESARTGVPMVRPLFWIAPQDETALAIEDEFLLGDNLLVAPVLDPRTDTRNIYFPQGDWYPFDPIEPAPAPPVHGPAWVKVEAPLGKLPLYARGGSVIPTLPLRQHTFQNSNPGEYYMDRPQYHIFEGDGSSELYEDAGDGFGYRDRGQFRRWTFASRRDHGGMVVGLRPVEGDFTNYSRACELHFRGADGYIASSFVDDGKPHTISIERPASAPPAIRVR